MSTIFVVVPEPKSPDETPRLTHIHRIDNPHGDHTHLRPGDDAIEVEDSTTIRRRIRSGDLRIATDAEVAKAKQGAEAKAKAIADAQKKIETQSDAAKKPAATK